MASPLIPDDVLRRTLEAVREHGGQRAAAKAMTAAGDDITRAGIQHRVNEAERRGITLDDIVVPVAAPRPPADIPIEELLQHRRKQFETRHAHNRAKRWREFAVPTGGPYALMFFGDPHIDDDGFNQPLFESHVDLAASTPCLYAVNIGDTTNNWTGRLARLWANQDASAETARRMVKHFLAERGVPWFLWLHGNHDLWDGPVGKEVFERHAPHFVTMDDWQAKVALVSPNGHRMRLWAAHNFKGNSIWNNMHGLERAAQMQDWAHLYVAGHHHDSGARQGENPHRGFVYNLMRVRGYKYDDIYANHHGFGEYQYGAAGVAIVDPLANGPSAVTCFLDPFEAVEFLQFKRRKAAA